MLKGLGQLAMNIGKTGMYGAGATALGAYGRTAQSAMLGAGAGGLWGAMSGDTSVLGGMAKGAGLGAGGYRYGYKSLKSAGRMGRSIMSNAGINTRGMGDFGAMGQIVRAGGIQGAGAMGAIAGTSAYRRAVTDIGGMMRGGSSLMSNMGNRFRAMRGGK